jgi:hypothetical protein
MITCRVWQSVRPRFERGGAPGRFEARWETRVGLLNEALAFLGLTADSATGAGRYELEALLMHPDHRRITGGLVTTPAPLQGR